MEAVGARGVEVPEQEAWRCRGKGQVPWAWRRRGQGAWRRRGLRGAGP